MLFQSATVYAALLVYFINALHIATLNFLLARIDRNNMSAYKLLLPYHLKRLKKKKILKKELALASFYCPYGNRRLDNSFKVICMDQ